jgi:hypothetical protein
LWQKAPVYAEGDACKAKFCSIGGIAYTADGELLIADSDNDRIRIVKKDRTFHTFAGTGQRGCLNGDRMSAT